MTKENILNTNENSKNNVKKIEDELTKEEKEKLFDLYLLEEYLYYGEV